MFDTIDAALNCIVLYNIRNCNTHAETDQPTSSFLCSSDRKLSLYRAMGVHARSVRKICVQKGSIRNLHVDAAENGNNYAKLLKSS